jgi:hypothetical protein
MIKIKVCGSDDIERQYGEVQFSSSINTDASDALFCYQKPSPELLDYQGVKAWYAIEKLSHSRYRRRGLWRQCYKALKPYEFLHFAHPDLRCRIPHYTTGHEDAFVVENKNRLEAAVAVVSNSGGRFWGLKSGVRLRNQFIVHPQVDLYGQPSWHEYRCFYGFGIKKAPSNYRGEPPVRWHSTRSHLEMLSAYKVNVCLENSTEPFYFTEKFVNAVRAGCIPIYHAHPDVCSTFLQGARWVDPGEFRFNTTATIDFALSQDLAEYRTTNNLWLKTPQAGMTFMPSLWKAFAEYFLMRIGE